MIQKVRGDNPPKFTFYHLPRERTKLYYGIELETGISTTSKRDVEYFTNILPDFVWPKWDGSILTGRKIKNDSDIEIVSHPATYKWLKANTKIWNKILDLRKKGLLSYIPGSCGMHIHIDKRAFKKSHKERFIGFIYKHQDFSHFISQRGPHMQYCSLNTNYLNEILSGYGGDKSTAINCCRPYTIEVRLFRGTLNKVSFWKNIEFCHSLYLWTKDHNQLMLTNYLDYISNKDYPNLNKWLDHYQEGLKGILKNASSTCSISS